MMWFKKAWKIAFSALAVPLFWSAMALASPPDETSESTSVTSNLLGAPRETDETPATTDTLQIQSPVPAQEGNPLVVAKDTLESSKEDEEAVTLPTAGDLQREKVSLDPPLLDPKTDPPESEMNIHPLPRPKGNAKPALLVLDNDPMREDKSFYGFLSYTIHW